MSERIDKPIDTSYLTYKGQLPPAELGVSQAYVDSILNGSLGSDMHSLANGGNSNTTASTKALTPSVRPAGVGGQLNVVSSATAPVAASTQSGPPPAVSQPQVNTLPPAQPEFGGGAVSTIAHEAETALQAGATAQLSDQALNVKVDNGWVTKGLLAVRNGLSALFGPKGEAATTQ
jgi:hypothetical protein